MIYYMISLVVVILDQTTKWHIAHTYSLFESRSVFGGFFQITSSRNKGAAFGILQNDRWFFVVVTIIIMIGIIWYLQKMRKQHRKLMPLALSLVLGGAVGNFADRALFGEVVDFLKVHFQFNFFGHHVDYVYPIFNLADSAVVIGVILIFLDTLLIWRQEKRALTGENHESNG